MFLYMVGEVHVRIMTNYSKWRRRIAESPKCGVCNEMFEDILHALRDCPETRLIWMHLVPSILI